jgi:tetratricopeptide (TPR) repeat protein
VELETSVLNFYARISSPVMLTFTDLTSAPKARDCKSYYLWIDDHLERLTNEGLKNPSNEAGIPQLPDTQKTHTFRIPIKNLINDELDVLPYLDKRQRTKNLGKEFVSAIDKWSLGEPTEIASDVISKFHTRDIALASLVEDDGERPWIKVPKNSVEEQLLQSSNYIDTGNLNRAQNILNTIEQTYSEDLSGHCQAELSYQQGRIYSFTGNYDEAVEKYADALKLLKTSTYDIAWCEARLSQSAENSADDVLKHLYGKEGTNYAFVRAKVFALKKEQAKALKEVEDLEGPRTFLCRSLIYLLSGEIEKCAEYAARNDEQP